MTEMKTLNGYEIVDAKSREDINKMKAEFIAPEIVQTTGDSETAVMSQKAVTEEMSKKLDVVTTGQGNRLYGINLSDQQAIFTVSEIPYAWAVAMRDANGRLTANDPNSSNQVATKRYVDNRVGSVMQTDEDVLKVITEKITISDDGKLMVGISGKWIFENIPRADIGTNVSFTYNGKEYVVILSSEHQPYEYALKFDDDIVSAIPSSENHYPGSFTLDFGDGIQFMTVRAYKWLTDSGYPVNE